jgi:hypothetical protein
MKPFGRLTPARRALIAAAFALIHEYAAGDGLEIQLTKGAYNEELTATARRQRAADILAAQRNLVQALIGIARPEQDALPGGYLIRRPPGAPPFLVHGSHFYGPTDLPTSFLGQRLKPAGDSEWSKLMRDLLRMLGLSGNR